MAMHIRSGNQELPRVLPNADIYSVLMSTEHCPILLAHSSSTETVCSPSQELIGRRLILHRSHVLGAFAELLKATISFVMSVRTSARPSVRMEQLGSH